MNAFGAHERRMEGAGGSTGSLPGYHWEAYEQLTRIYDSRMGRLRQQKGAVSVLDFGSGTYGAGRSILEISAKDQDDISLYDQSAVQPSNRKNIQVVGPEAVFGCTPKPFDIVTLSYVLCHLEDDEAHELLRQLVHLHNQAEFIITDYILQGRQDAHQVLSADEERKWRKRLGAEQFLRMRTRFSMLSLLAFAEESGLEIADENASPLDRAGTRGTVIGRARENASSLVRNSA